MSEALHIFVLVTLGFVIGLILGIAYTMYLIRKGIREADIAPEDRRMMQDALGIRP